MPTISELTLGVFSDDPYPALEEALVDSEHPHPRARVRDGVLQRLQAAAAQPERVVAELATAADIDALPLVLVFTTGEPEPAVRAESPRELGRTCEVVVDAAVAESNIPQGITLADALDAFTRVVELLLLNDHDEHGEVLDGRGYSLELGASRIEIEQRGERVVFHARVVFLVGYADELAIPASTPLEEVDVRWDLALPDGQLEAEDLVEPEQQP